jgi:putative copper resistance protein D
MVAAWVVMPAARRAAPLAFMASLSRAATWALGIIVLTGVFAAWQRLGSPARLVDHPYGVLLSIKLGLVGLAAGLGAFNRFVGFPAAKSGSGERALLVLRVESVVLLGALAVAAMLTMQHPPR